ncbi:hypothetical protein RN001_014358 [Aquatica leii]|uniref:Uncharacterized protein n=1 Tax=Aquatica leii TaxID=1421715 RepID=A0AAN7PNA4_9COLE|nr:hypothetical protein RN001_014358 [Aquatica leii]
MGKRIQDRDMKIWYKNKSKYENRRKIASNDEPVSKARYSPDIMKFVITVIFCLAGLFYCVQAECNAQNSYNIPYNCGKNGESHFYLNEAGECAYTCIVNGSHKTCAQVHPTKNAEKYANSKCKNDVFDCEGHGSEHIHEEDDYCSYGCRAGDIILVCGQVHSL